MPTRRRPPSSGVVTLTNELLSPRRLELVAFVEWNCGVTPSPRREFTKLFLECERDAGRNAVFARSHMWEVGSERWGHWNTELSVRQRFRLHRAASRRPRATRPRSSAASGASRLPRPSAGNPWPGLFGRHDDAVAALRVPIEIPAGGVRDLGFVLATAETDEETRALLDRFGNVEALDASLAAAKRRWTGLLAAHRIETPDATFDAFLNDWVRYQAISARI